MFSPGEGHPAVRLRFLHLLAAAGSFVLPIVPLLGCNVQALCLHCLIRKWRAPPSSSRRGRQQLRQCDGPAGFRGSSGHSRAAVLPAQRLCHCSPSGHGAGAAVPECKLSGCFLYALPPWQPLRSFSQHHLMHGGTAEVRNLARWRSVSTIQSLLHRYLHPWCVSPGCTVSHGAAQDEHAAPYLLPAEKYGFFVAWLLRCGLPIT